MQRFIRIMLVFFCLNLLLGSVTILTTRYSDSADEAFNLVFVSSRSGYADDQIYRMRIDGRDIVQLTSSDARHVAPHWSPDGQWIAFTLIGEDLQINQVRPDGSDFQMLLPPGADFRGRYNPNWSPDGKWLAFVMRPDLEDSAEIYRYRLSDGYIERLTDSAGNNWYPVWSPDGQWIAFISHRHGPPEIYRIHVESGEEERLTDSRQSNYYPSWSPDGEWIVFNSDREDNRMHIYRKHIASGKLERLTYTGNNLLPAWSPGGNWIAYVSEQQGQSAEIYLMRPDGSGVQRITTSEGVNVYPAWGPLQQSLPVSMALPGIACGILLLFVFWRRYAKLSF